MQSLSLLNFYCLYFSIAFSGTSRIRIPMIRSLWNGAICYQLFDFCFICSLNICKGYAVICCWKGFLIPQTGFLIFFWKKLVPAKPGQGRLCFVGKCFTFVDIFSYYGWSYYEFPSLFDVNFRRYQESKFEFLWFFSFHLILLRYAILW